MRGEVQYMAIIAYTLPVTQRATLLCAYLLMLLISCVDGLQLICHHTNLIMEDLFHLCYVFL